MTKKLINEYEAALRFDLSPTLLRWITSNGVVDKIKISYEERNEVYYYDQNELARLNQKMEGKWPKTTKGKRPNIPEGIKREIKHEARSSCPVCNKSHGEIAHVDCVSATHCNHPKNLIFLCPDHHTEYDNARIPTNIDRDEVLILKEGLKIFQRQIWKIQGNTIKSCLAGLNSAKSLLSIHEIIRSVIPEAEFKEALEKIAESTEGISGTNIARDNFRNSDFINTEITSYIAKNQENICPLCSGQGATSFYDSCPVCLGDGEVIGGNKEPIDLSIYMLVDCRLCGGSGAHNNIDCPACGCKGQVSQHFFDYHDWSMYDLVPCKLCDGSGKYHGDDCPGCGCEGQISQHFYDTHDWSMYDLVPCKLCDGNGIYHGDDCPACECVGKVSQYFYDYHDWTQHELVSCQLCKGEGRYHANDCMPCNGEGRVSQHFNYHHDWGQYR